jgi:hypothetical protein
VRNEKDVFNCGDSGDRYSLFGACANTNARDQSCNARKLEHWSPDRRLGHAKSGERRCGNDPDNDESFEGGASFNTVLSSNLLYDVTLNGADGTQLVKFPVTTALINAANLEQASINLVFNSKDKTIKSASITVNLRF